MNLSGSLVAAIFSHTTSISLRTLTPLIRLFRPSFYPTRLFFSYICLLIRPLAPCHPRLSLRPSRPFVIAPLKKNYPVPDSHVLPSPRCFPPATWKTNTHYVYPDTTSQTQVLYPSPSPSSHHYTSTHEVNLNALTPFHWQPTYLSFTQPPPPPSLPLVNPSTETPLLHPSCLQKVVQRQGSCVAPSLSPGQLARFSSLPVENVQIFGSCLKVVGSLQTVGLRLLP